MKHMRTVTAADDPLPCFRMAITADMVALFEDKASPAELFHLVRKHRAEKSGPHNQVIVLELVHGNLPAHRYSVTIVSFPLQRRMQVMARCR
jgi:hypothetical protein